MYKERRVFAVPVRGSVVRRMTSRGDEGRGMSIAVGVSQECSQSVPSGCAELASGSMSITTKAFAATSTLIEIDDSEKIEDPKPAMIKERSGSLPKTS